MLKAKLEVGIESLEVYYNMFDESEGVIYAVDGTELVRTSDKAVDDCAILHLDGGPTMSIKITRRNLIKGLGWSVGSLNFALLADPPPAIGR